MTRPPYPNIGFGGFPYNPLVARRYEMHYTQPLVATVITNPTNRDLKYTWLGKNGTFVRAGSTVTVPYEVHTAANVNQRAQLAQAINSKLVTISYESRNPTRRVKAISNKIVKNQGVETPVEVVPKVEAPKVEAPKVAPVKPKSTRAERQARREARRETRRNKRMAEQLKREQVIIPVAEDKTSKLKDTEDLVQKVTGQETLTMREAMGWDDPDTDDTREEQEVADIDMEAALTENVGDPLAKLAAEEKKRRTAVAQEKKREAARVKTKDANTKKAAEVKKAKKPKKAKKDKAPKKITSAADTAKRSAAGKKAAETRKKNRELQLTIQGGKK